MLIHNKNYRTIWYDNIEDNIKIIDQTKLPYEFVILSLKNVEDVILAIKTMKVRGAPLIGATAAYGVYLAYRDFNDKKRF